MADVFQTTPMEFGGGFKSDKGMLESSDGLSGVLMQNINITYTRPVTKIFELGNVSATTGTKVYYVEGRPQGSLTLGRILGFGATIAAFYKKYGSVCRARTNTLRLSLNSIECKDPAIANSGPVALKMTFCVLTSVGVAVTVQNFVVSENCAMEFANMTYTGA